MMDNNYFKFQICKASSELKQMPCMKSLCTPLQSMTGFIKKALWLSMLIAVLLMFLGSSVVVLAQEDKVDLSLRLLPEYYYKEVIPGEDTILYMEVKNNGDKEITNIVFVSDNPKDWVVDFKPRSISHLGSGSSQTVDISVIPSRDTGKGEYHLTFLAEANETRAAASTILRVENTSYSWLWIGIGLAGIVIIGFIFVYLRFGKQ
ncbi:NEW3 domain-containing protein [Chloroflexota bacterium]